MSQFCEDVITENEKLKILDDLEIIYLTIFNYLNKNHEINYLKISIINKSEQIVLFKSFDEDSKDFCNELKFNQNLSTQIIFDIYSLTEEENEIIKNSIVTIKLCLQIFSQSLYNKYIESSIHELSLIDALTGSYNRRYLDNYAHNFLSIANREQKKIAFIKIGIDQFKAVIDEFNYAIGDEVLKSLAKSLKNGIRTSDLVVKISSDEFLVILMNIINEENATMIAQKLVDNFSEEKVIVNKETNYTLMKTICGGVSIFPDDASNLDDIIKKSDIALYEARNRGRSQIFKYTIEDTNIIDFF